MRIHILAKPGKSRQVVRRETNYDKEGMAGYVVEINAQAHKGQANKAILAALGEYFGVPVTQISIRGGQRGKYKIVEIAVN